MKKIETDTADILKEKALVKLVQSGTEKEKQNAFNQLYVRHKESIFYMALKSVKMDKELARDLTQEIFIKVFDKINTFTPEFAFSTWLYKIATNHIIDSKRQSKHEVLSFESLGVNLGSDSEDSNVSKQIFQLEDKSADSYGLAVKTERADVVNRAIASLKNEREKEVLISFYMNEKSHEEISRELNVSVGNLKSILFRARESVKRYLSKESVDFTF